MSSCIVCKTNLSGRQHALECDVCRQWTTFCCAKSDGYTFLVLVQGRKFQGAKVPGSECSLELSLPGAKVPGNESSWEQKFQGAKVPGSESSTYGTFALGSESTWERKFHNSLTVPPLHGIITSLGLTGRSSLHYCTSDRDSDGSSQVSRVCQVPQTMDELQPSKTQRRQLLWLRTQQQLAKLTISEYRWLLQCHHQ